MEDAGGNIPMLKILFAALAVVGFVVVTVILIGAWLEIRREDVSH